MTASLLTRIEHAANPNNTDRYTWRDHDLEAAVLTHLRKMLNTRQGSSLAAPDYGILEVSELTDHFPDAIGIVQRSIKNSISLYEPRMKNVQVRHLKNDKSHNMMLEFEISGQIVHPDGRKQAIRFGTGVDGNGNISIQQ